RLRDLLRRNLDLRLAHRLLAPLCRHALLIGARLLHSRVTARTSAAGAATLARTTLSAAGTAPALPHRAEALAVRPTPAAALAGGAESFERSAAAPPCVLVAQARVTVTEAIGHDLALVDPDLDADAPGRRLRLDEAVVDVRANRVQRDTSLAVHLAPAHLAAAKAARALDLHAGGAGTNRGSERPLHRAPEGDAVRELLGNRLRDELRVELRALDLVDVDVDVLLGQRVQVTPQRIDLDAGLADHDPRPRRVDVDGDPLLVLADQDVGQARVRELGVDVLADPYVLQDVVRELLLAGVPVGLPVVDHAHAEPARMNLLAHYSSLSSGVSASAAGSSASASAAGSSVSSTSGSSVSSTSASSTASGSSTGSGAAIAGTAGALDTGAPCARSIVMWQVR